MLNSAGSSLLQRTVVSILNFRPSQPWMPDSRQFDYAPHTDVSVNRRIPTFRSTTVVQ